MTYKQEVVQLLRQMLCNTLCGGNPNMANSLRLVEIREFPSDDFYCLHFCSSQGSRAVKLPKVSVDVPHRGTVCLYAACPACGEVMFTVL